MYLNSILTNPPRVFLGLSRYQELALKVDHFEPWTCGWASNSFPFQDPGRGYDTAKGTCSDLFIPIQRKPDIGVYVGCNDATAETKRYLQLLLAASFLFKLCLNRTPRSRRANTSRLATPSSPATLWKDRMNGPVGPWIEGYSQFLKRFMPFLTIKYG